MSTLPSISMDRTQRAGSAPMGQKSASTPSLGKLASKWNKDPRSCNTSQMSSTQGGFRNLSITQGPSPRVTDELVRIVSQRGDSVELECDMPPLARSMGKYMKAYVVALEYTVLNKMGAGNGLNPLKAIKKKLVAEDAQCAPRVRLRQHSGVPYSERFTTYCEMKLTPAPCVGGESLVLFQVVVEANTDNSFWTAMGTFAETLVPTPDLAITMLQEFPETEQALMYTPRKLPVVKCDSKCQTEPQLVSEVIEYISRSDSDEVSKCSVSDATLLDARAMLQKAMQYRKLTTDEEEEIIRLRSLLASEAKTASGEADALRLRVEELQRQLKDGNEDGSKIANALADERRALEEERQKRQQAEEQLKLLQQALAEAEEQARLSKEALEEAAKLGALDKDKRGKAEEEMRLRKEAEESERRRKAEEDRLKAEEDARRALEDERQKRQQAEEQLKLIQQSLEESEARARRSQEALEEAMRMGDMDHEQMAKAQEEMRLKMIAEEADRKRKEEEAAERKRKLDEEVRQKAEEEAARRKAEDEEARRKAEEEARRLAEEEARRHAEEEALLRSSGSRALEEEHRALEEERLKRQQVEEQLKKVQQALEEAEERARRSQEALEKEMKRGELDHEEMAKAQEEMRLRMEAEEAELRRLEEEAKRREEADERRRKEDEEAKERRKAEEEERRRKAEEDKLAAEEAGRRKAEEEAKRKAEEEALRKAEEDAKLRGDEEARLRAEEARLRSEEEARLKAEEEARLRALKEIEDAKSATRTRLKVTVMRAENLRAADYGGKSDPYCMVHIVGREEDPKHPHFKTDIQKKTLEPVWNQEHMFDACTLSDELLFEVFDHDDRGKDDTLGSVILEPDVFRHDDKMFEGPLVLGEKKRRSSIFRKRSKSKMDSKTGELLEPTLYVKVEVFPMVRIPDIPRCFVKIVSASNLRGADRNGKSDPYCVCEVPGKPMTRFKTKHIDKTLNPEWREEAEINEYAKGDNLELHVYDHDRGKSVGDVLGTVLISSGKFDPEGFEGTIALQGQGALENSTVTLRVDVF